MVSRLIRNVCLTSAQASRTQMLDDLATLKKEHAQLECELAAYGACDPAKVEEKRRAVVLAKEAAVRWTGECRVYTCYEFAGVLTEYA